VDLARAGSLSLAFADQAYHDDRRSRLTQFNWMRSFEAGFNVQAFVRRLDGMNEETTLGVVFSKALGERQTASASLQSVNGQFEAVAELNQQLPADDGLGYRLRSTAGRSARQEIDFSANAGVLRVDSDVRRTSGGTGMSGFVGGSLAWMDGFYAARQIRDSFAIVDSGGVPDVRVYRENQEVGRTGKDGRLLVPALRPFDVNRLSLELTDLPLDARLDHSVRHVVPFGRSGTSVDFGVVRTRSAVLHLLDAAGEPVPAGAVARSGEAEVPVGYGGMVYLPDAIGVEVLQVRWPAGRCNARLPALPDAEPLPDLGAVACHAE
jgi:outer membrane usher protein